jgi:hypothetical protein
MNLTPVNESNRSADSKPGTTTIGDGRGAKAQDDNEIVPRLNLRMKRMRLVYATIIAGSLLLPMEQLSAEVTCAELRLKPLRCVCGTIINEAGEVVPRATIRVLKGGTEIASVATGVDGKFAFSELKAATYGLWVGAEGFRLFEFPIVVQNPSKQCRQVLEIVLLAGGLETCESIRLVKR